MVKTKIICTIGPRSSSIAMLRNMMLAGMDVARLNFSHGTLLEHARRIILIRQLNRKYRRHIKILQDLEGYRIRIGTFQGKREIALKKRQALILSNGGLKGEKGVVPFDYTGPLTDIKAGTQIFLDDGNISLVVKKNARRYLETEVIIPGVLKENKGVNIPSVNLRFKGLTPKDKIDIEFGIKNKVDYMAQSFVRDKFDIGPIRDLIKSRLPECKIIAKIENRQGIQNIDEIIDASDGIMIARGDMGVSIPIYEIPIVQKEIIKKCNQAKKFVITATQMLESMTQHLRPTRAEVTDVANAILDGSDFVMLSAETAAGKYPVEATEMMNEVIKFTESSDAYRSFTALSKNNL